MKKYLLIACLITTQFINLQAQFDLEKIFKNWYRDKREGSNIIREKTLNDAEIVFEGLIKYYNSTYYLNGGEVKGITYCIVDAKEVFKGKMALGRVKVVFGKDDFELPKCDSATAKDTFPSIFFCKKTSELKRFLSKETNNDSNLLILGGFNESKSWEWNEFQMGPGFHGFDKKFESKGAVYDYLRTYSGLNIPVYEDPPKVINSGTNNSKSLTGSQTDSISNNENKPPEQKKDSTGINL